MNNTLTLIGHASVKIKTAEGIVIYIDPFADGDYSEAADLILVTHGHHDHCKTEIVTKKSETMILSYKELHPEEKTYLSKKLGDVTVTAVPAYNKNHPKKDCVGFVVDIGSVKIYHAGDTNKIPEMKELAALHIDYALFPVDGKYNMDAKEATKCAELIGAKHNLPFHTFNLPTNAFKDTFTPAGCMFAEYGETIEVS